MTFSTFWEQRNSESTMFLDSITGHYLGTFIAFASHKLGISANQLSVTSGIFGALAFFAAVILPVEQHFLSVVIIFLLAQTSSLLDHADGQLARATNTTSEFGAFLDRGMDIFNMYFGLGSIFIYAYRHLSYLGLNNQADLFLIAGFVFLGGRACRYFVFEMFALSFHETYVGTKTKDSVVTSLLKNIMDHQFTLFNMLVFLWSPMACLSILAFQAVIFLAVYVRYFLRAWPK